MVDWTGDTGWSEMVEREREALRQNMKVPCAVNDYDLHYTFSIQQCIAEKAAAVSSLS